MENHAAGGPRNGDRRRVTGGVHAGKSGTVEDLHLSKTGHLTVTIRQEDGIRFKTLAKNLAAPDA